MKILKEEFELDNWSLREKVNDIYDMYEWLSNTLSRFNPDNCSDLDKERIKVFVEKTDEFLKQGREALGAMRRSK